MLKGVIILVGVALMTVGGAGMYFGTALALLDDGTVSTSYVLAAAAAMWGVFGPPVLLGFHLTFTRWSQNTRTDRIIVGLIGMSGLLGATVLPFLRASPSVASGFIAIFVVSAGSSALLILALSSRPERS